MPSFDIVSIVDVQEVDNAVNNVKKEVATRYDFRGVTTEIDLNRKDMTLSFRTGDEMKMRALVDMLQSHCIRRKVDPKFIEFGEIEGTSQGAVKMSAKIREGIEKETAQKIVKKIKAMKLKVQPSIQDDQVRVQGKKLDELQDVIAMCREEDFGLPLQFQNMKK